MMDRGAERVLLLRRAELVFKHHPLNRDRTLRLVGPRMTQSSG